MYTLIRIYNSKAPSQTGHRILLENHSTAKTAYIDCKKVRNFSKNMWDAVHNAIPYGYCIAQRAFFMQVIV